MIATLKLYAGAALALAVLYVITYVVLGIA
jgi:hypothetical protein